MHEAVDGQPTVWLSDDRLVRFIFYKEANKKAIMPDISFANSTSPLRHCSVFRMEKKIYCLYISPPFSCLEDSEHPPGHYAILSLRLHGTCSLPWQRKAKLINKH